MEFCTPDGDIDWEKLVAFNSGRQRPPTRSRLLKETEEAYPLPFPENDAPGEAED